MRNNLIYIGFDKNIVDNLDSALEKLPTYKGKVYRNIQFDRFGDKAARDDFVAKHVAGDIASYDAYISSSLLAIVNSLPIESNTTKTEHLQFI